MRRPPPTHNTFTFYMSLVFKSSSRCEGGKKKRGGEDDHDEMTGAVVKKSKKKTEEELEAIAKKKRTYEAFENIFRVKKLLQKIFLIVDSCAPFVRIGMTSIVFHKLIWLDYTFSDLMMNCWDQRLDKSHSMGSRSDEEKLPNFRKNIGLSDGRYLQLVGSRHIAVNMRSKFLNFAKRLLFLETVYWCGMCGRSQNELGVMPGFWLLGCRVCTECCSNHFISGHRLVKTFGIALDSRIGGGKMLIEHMVGKVFMIYFDTVGNVEGKWRKLTMHLDDIRNYSATASMVFMWMPHLEKLLNLHGKNGLRQFLEDKKKAYTQLVPYFQTFNVRAAVLAAQNEGKKKKIPSALITLQRFVREKFTRELRQSTATMAMPKRKQRKVRKADFVYKEVTTPIIQMIELCEVMTTIAKKIL